MKVLKLMLIILILAGLMVSTFGCGSESSEVEEMETQVVTVQRGDLTVDITAAGNLALSRTEDLAIDLFYEEGTVEEVLVEEGDTVKEGQVLAKLDTEEWEDELSTLEDQVTAKERDLLQAKINIQTAEQNLKNSRDNKAAKELALLNAQISLRDAEHNLDEMRDIYTWPEIVVAQDDVDDAKAFLQYVIDRGLPTETRQYAQARLDAAEAILDAKVNSYDTEEVAIATMQVQSAEMALAQAEEDLDEVAKDVALKELQLVLSQGRLADAEKALIDAQEELDDANSKSPLIVALFDGFITSVNVEGGDEVLTGTVAVQLADPNKFEADILVSEMDILQVKENGEAWVQVDALPGMSLPATVTHISPTATIQSGVVNYGVTVEVEPLETAAQVSTMFPEDFQLREGLTVTVIIIVTESTDVLLVPNGAVTQKGAQSYVQIVTVSGESEQRAIQTGVSDWQFTEVTSGLSEGEQVLVPQGTAPATTQEGSPGGFPGIMRPH